MQANDSDVAFVCYDYNPLSGSSIGARGNGGKLAVYSRSKGTTHCMAQGFFDVDTFVFSPSLYKRVDIVEMDRSSTVWVYQDVNKNMFPSVSTPNPLWMEGTDFVQVDRHVNTEGTSFLSPHRCDNFNHVQVL
jgi:hypothetical protein